MKKLKFEVENQCKKQGCTNRLSPQELLDCEKERTVPICSEHKVWFKEQVQKCAPLFSKMNVS